MPVLRQTTLADAPAIDALLALSYPRLLAPDYPAGRLAAVLPGITRAKPALLESGTYFVLTEGSLALAAGGWTAGAPSRDAAPTPDLGHVRHVVSHPDHLRQGHARRVMERVFRQARDHGMTALECLSTRTAVPFYASLGFRTEAEVEVTLAYGMTFPSIRMTRAL